MKSRISNQQFWFVILELLIVTSISFLIAYVILEFSGLNAISCKIINKSLTCWHVRIISYSLIFFTFFIFRLCKDSVRGPKWIITLFGMVTGYICGLISLQLSSLFNFPGGIVSAIIGIIKGTLKIEKDIVIIFISPLIELGWLFGFFMGLSFYLLLRKRSIL